MFNAESERIKASLTPISERSDERCRFEQSSSQVGDAQPQPAVAFPKRVSARSDWSVETEREKDLRARAAGLCAEVLQILPVVQIVDAPRMAWPTRVEALRQPDLEDLLKGGRAKETGPSEKKDDGWQPTDKPSTKDLSLTGMTDYFERLAEQQGLDENQGHAFRHIAAAAYFTQKYGPRTALALGDPKKLVDLSIGGLNSAYQLTRAVAQSAYGYDMGPLKDAWHAAGKLLNERRIDVYNDVHNNHEGIRAGMAGLEQRRSWPQIEKGILTAVRAILPNREHNHHYMPHIDWRKLFQEGALN